MMLVFVILILYLIYVFMKYFKIYNEYWKKRNVKQVNGVLWKFLKGKQCLSEMYKEVYDAHPNLPCIGTFLGTRPALILRDPKNIQAVLDGDFQSFHSRGLFTNVKEFLADNLLFMEDHDRWKLLRKKMLPYFNKTNLKNIFYLTERCARDLIDYLDEKYQIEDPYKALYLYNEACISSTIFGINKESRVTMKPSFSEIAYKSLNPTLTFNMKFAISNFSPTLFKWLNLKPFGVYEDYLKDLTKFLMETRRKENKVYHDFIDMCLKFEDEGTLKDYATGYEIQVNLEFLAAQSFLFILAAIDNPVNVMHMTLLEISKNPKILQRIHNEVDEIFKNSNGTLTFEDIEKLEYLEMVINESLRKYPPIGIMQRRCFKDTVLPVGEVKVEKDTIIIIPYLAIHRDEKYFPNSDVFDPERFSANNLSKLVKYTFLPFGEGKRNCIGTKFAIIQMKTGLAWLLHKYTVKEQSYTPTRFKPSFLQIFDPNVKIEIVKRFES